MNNTIYFMNGERVYAIGQKREHINFKTLKKEDSDLKRNKIYMIPPLEMKWNRDGTPDYSHLDSSENRKLFNNSSKGSMGLPVLEMRWNKDGSPDYSHLS